MKKYLTQEQKRELLQMLENGATSEEIELKFNIKERTVYQYRMGLRGKLTKPLKEQFLEDTVKEQRDGVEGECWVWPKGISLYLGEKTGTLSKVAYEVLVESVPEGQLVFRRCNNQKCVNPKHLFLSSKGEPIRGQSTMTEDKVRAIRAGSAEGKSLSQLGKEFGVTPSTISLIVNRKRWAHVE